MRAVMGNGIGHIRHGVCEQAFGNHRGGGPAFGRAKGRGLTPSIPSPAPPQRTVTLFIYIILTNEK